MAKINMKLQKESNKVEAGDIVISSLLGTRMIVASGDKYVGVCLENGIVSTEEKTLEQIEDLYCTDVGNFRVIKADNIEISEVGGSR
ncbi:hypothetical protein UT300003_32490 [Clostridium sardiniense]